MLRVNSGRAKLRQIAPMSPLGCALRRAPAEQVTHNQCSQPLQRSRRPTTRPLQTPYRTTVGVLASSR